MTLQSKPVQVPIEVCLLAIKQEAIDPLQACDRIDLTAIYRHMLEYLDHMSPTLDSRYKFDNGFLLYESGLPYVGLGQHPYHRPESFWGKLVDRQILIADLDCLESQNSFGKLLSLDNSGFTFTPPIPHALNAIVDELINGFFRKEHGLVEQLADG